MKTLLSRKESIWIGVVVAVVGFAFNVDLAKIVGIGFTLGALSVDNE